MSDEDPTDEPDEPLGDLRNDISSRTDDESSDERAPPADSADDPALDDSADDRSPHDSAENESADGPLGALRREVDSRTAADDSDASDAAVDDTFAEMRVDDIDSEDLWADLLLDDGPTEGSFPPTATTHRAEGTYHEVTKRLCHRCEYFGDPPILHCTHEGTTIHELVDMDHYLVSDCPMVDTEGGSEERS